MNVYIFTKFLGTETDSFRAKKVQESSADILTNISSIKKDENEDDTYLTSETIVKEKNHIFPKFWWWWWEICL